ncbi:MAG TPA: hypothetical protein VL202_00990 [Pararhizobium sp.]|uniref:hypothetical protein n=1 Tax=Pararhizobium sp. TaxID=1977563 RepID=UPI002CCCC5DA|nr:hypothetical protein [Pararhizobium sp.]HTO29745.1 hypothetical protein [Pararhizobium sp.]
MSFASQFCSCSHIFLTQKPLFPVKAGWNDICPGIAISIRKNLSNWKNHPDPTGVTLYTTFLNGELAKDESNSSPGECQSQIARIVPKRFK